MDVLVLPALAGFFLVLPLIENAYQRLRKSGRRRTTFIK